MHAFSQLSQGTSCRVAAGEVVPEELLPGGGEQEQGEESRRGQQQQHAVRSGAGEHQRLLRQSEYGRSALPKEGRHEDVQGLPGAQGGPGGHVRLLLRGRRRRFQRRREPGRVRHHLRGQGRRPHACRRCALRVSVDPFDHFFILKIIL
ncbi:hypothetical protein VPH35_099778 [Triticum aestivum]